MFTVYQGHAQDILKDIPQCNIVLTSPPYFRKRKYGNESKKEIGQEKSLEAYIGNLVDLFNAIPLHRRGSIWVNLGDTRDQGLMMVPERFALAMCDSGWLLLDSVVWAKVCDNSDGTTEGGCMPEPAPGRLNANGYEMLYRFSRLKDAWSDTCAVRIPRSGNPAKRYLPEPLMRANSCIEGRNLHNIWRIPTGQTNRKHYAVYPTVLCERPIAMTCPIQQCSQCGHLRERLTEMVVYDEARYGKRLIGKYNSPVDSQTAGRMDQGRQYIPRKPQTVGWSDCDHKQYVPGIVLDPFSGSGTTGEVAIKLGRDFIGIDLYSDYCEMTVERCQETVRWLEKDRWHPAEIILNGTAGKGGRRLAG